MNTLYQLNAVEATRLIRSKRISVKEYVQSCLSRIEKIEPNIHAWVVLDKAKAISEASRIDQKVHEGIKKGKLVGVPVGVKDIFNTIDFPTQMGSPIWNNFMPGNDSRVVSHLRWEDAIIPGKTVTAEFAVHTPGPTHNPHKHGYMTGTSSSGSAAAVASQMVPLALGTQTAGSTIRPASYCGVYGMKPSFGLLPRTGMLKTTDSLDTIGFFSRCVSDLELLLDVLRIHGNDYPISSVALRRDLIRQTTRKKIRIGLVTDSLWVWEQAEPYAKDAIRALAQKVEKLPSIEVTTLSLPPDFNDVHHTHETIYNKTLSYYFKGEYERKRLVSTVMQELVEKGQRISVETYKQALQKQQYLARLLEKVLKKKQLDIILTLSTGGEAMKGLEAVDRPDSCLIWTLCWVPVVTLPVFTGPLGLPFGAQLVAPRYHDYSLLALAHTLEEKLQIKPPVVS